MAKINNVIGLEVRRRLLDIEDLKHLSAEAQQRSLSAEEMARLAELLSKSTKEELDQIVIEGDSSVEAAQARVDAKGEAHTTLKERLDSEWEKTDEKLRETENISVSLKIKGNESDAAQKIQTMLDSGEGNSLTFPKNINLTLDKPLDLSKSKFKDVNFNGAVIKTINDGLIINNIYHDDIEISNLILVGDGTNNGSVGLNLGDNRKWGASVNLKNVEIREFSTGILANSIFNTSSERLLVTKCKLGIRLKRNENDHEDISFSNVNLLTNMVVTSNDVAFYITNSQNIIVSTCTFENNNYGVVIGRRLESIEFKNNWFEKNSEADVTIGEYNVATGVLDKSSDESSINESFNEVSFKNTRWSVDRQNNPFIDKKFKFLSEYYDNGNSFYRTNKMFKSHKLNYKNLVYNLPDRFHDSGSSSETHNNIHTMFGNKKVHNINGIGQSINTRLMFHLENEINHNDFILIKMLVKVDKVGFNPSKHYFNIRLSNSSEQPITQPYVGDENVRTGSWVEVNRILKITNNRVNDSPRLLIHPNRRMGSSNPSDKVYEGELGFSVTNVMVVNLTKLFGRGNEPGRESEYFLSDMFEYKTNEETQENHFSGYSTGSNSNGNYIKYDDGTLICYRDSTHNTGNQDHESHTMPYRMKNVGFVGTSLGENSPVGRGDIELINNVGTYYSIAESVSYWVLRSSPSGSKKIKVKLYAIGRWK